MLADLLASAQFALVLRSHKPATAQHGDGWDDLFIYLLLLDDPSMHVNQHFQKWMSPALVPDRGPGFQKY